MVIICFSLESEMQDHYIKEAKQIRPFWAV